MTGRVVCLPSTFKEKSKLSKDAYVENYRKVMEWNITGGWLPLRHEILDDFDYFPSTHFSMFSKSAELITYYFCYFK